MVANQKEVYLKARRGYASAWMVYSSMCMCLFLCIVFILAVIGTLSGLTGYLVYGISVVMVLVMVFFGKGFKWELYESMRIQNGNVIYKYEQPMQLLLGSSVVYTFEEYTYKVVGEKIIVKGILYVKQPASKRKLCKKCVIKGLTDAGMGYAIDMLKKGLG